MIYLLSVEHDKISMLKGECNEQVYDAVVSALKEMNEYNPSGRYSLVELLNKKDNRTTTMKEGVEFMLRQ